MIIKYENKIKDMLYFNILSLFRFPANLIIVIIFAINAVLTYYESISLGLVFYIIRMIIFITGFIVLIIMITFVLVMILLVVKGFRNILCEHVMEFNNDFFIEKTEFNETKYPWGAIQKLKVTGNYILIYVSSTTAHIIPKRYLSETEIMDLLQLLNNKRPVK